jgi:hypothetical protein
MVGGATGGPGGDGSIGVDLSVEANVRETCGIASEENETSTTVDGTMVAGTSSWEQEGACLWWWQGGCALATGVQAAAHCTLAITTRSAITNFSILSQLTTVVRPTYFVVHRFLGD